MPIDVLIRSYCAAPSLLRRAPKLHGPLNDAELERR
jgi:hypothetical protein